MNEDASEARNEINENEVRQDPFPYYLPITQWALRLLGVYLLVVGLSSAVEDFGILLQYRQYYQDRYADDSLITLPQLPRFVGSMIYFFAGVYLVSSGGWVIETIFLPAPPDADESPE